ncbi:MAG: IS701 family transposase [Chloroflexi bacterium]|nr:IS701 family transposase [Chloroflexota bacterium]
MKWNSAHWRRKVTELQKFVEPLVAEIGRSERRENAALYVQGLLMPGQRKSIEPMAERLRVDSQKLQQFMSDSPWQDRPVWEAIRREVIPVVEPLQAWVVDETGWLKQGQDSVGVSHQYCGAVGKQANCQVAVELVVSDGEVAAPVGGRLYLPEVWAQDLPRREKVGVPSTVRFQTKPEIAGDLIAAALADGLTAAPILGDAVYGNAAELRGRIRRLGLEYFLNAEDHWLAWTRRPKLTHGPKLWSVAQTAPQAQTLRQWAVTFRGREWQAAAWQAAEGEKRATRLAWKPIYLHSDLEEKTGKWPPCWLVVDWPEGQADPYHVYVAWLKQPPAKGRMLRLSRGRWPIEQYFQRGKDDLGLDHYEGRSWRGFHHHLAMAAIAYLFVVVDYLRAKKNFWPDVGTGLASDAAIARALTRLLSLLPDGN